MRIQQRIESVLREALEPLHLLVENESHRHNVPPNSETHFKLIVVSPHFIGQGQVKRHQQVYALLREELAGPVHALALHTYAPEEWRGADQVSPSPNCMGGEAKQGD